MSSNDGRFASGSKLRQYLLIETLGEDQLGFSWTAQDTILGRLVTLQIVHRPVCSDPDRLALIAAEVRAAGHLDHPAIAKVYEMDHAGEVHFIVSEFVEGQSLSSELRDIAIDSAPLVQIALAIGEALDYAHSHGVIHGNLHSRHILVASDGRVKVLGFGGGRGSSAHQEMRPDDGELESICYLAPERIVGRPLDVRSDVFAFGVLLYEMATGARPFTGDTAAEICERILHAAPAAPHLVNPAVAPSMVGIIGRCIQKDPSRRYTSAGAVLADLRKVASEAQRPSENSSTRPAHVPEAEIETTVGAPPSEMEIETVASRSADDRGQRNSGARTSVILYVAVSESGAAPDESSRALATRMQQILDETVYLADGKIIDPFAEQVIAEFGSAADAVRAARKGLHDLETYNSRHTGRAPTIDAKLVVLQGDVETVDGSLRGPAVEMARVASRAIAPMKLAISGEILRETFTQPESGPLLTVAGRTFFEISSASVLAQPVQLQPSDAEIAPIVEQRPRFGMRARVIAIGVSALLVTGLAAAVFFVKKNAAAELEAKRRAGMAAKSRVTVPAGPTLISVEAFSIADNLDPSAIASAELVRYGALGLLNSLRELEVVPQSNGNRSRFTAEVRQGASGPELVPLRLAPAAKEGTAIPLNGLAAASFANWIAGEMSVRNGRFEVTDPFVLERFSRSVAAVTGREEAPEPQTVASIRDAIRADPLFLPAQLLAIDIFERAGDRKSAIGAATNSVQLDPENLIVRRRLARWLYQSGDPTGAAAHFSEVLARDRTDHDALTAAGLYALALNDKALFDKAMGELEGTTGSKLLHRPDLLLASAQIDRAASPYFDIEREQPDNAALALKIGRIAVLRHMNSIAEIELQKLERLDPSYGLPMLRAYVHAQHGRRDEAEAELRKAQLVAPWHAQPYTNSAEVYAILGAPARVIESLEMAVARGEPTGAYVMSNPLFRYLKGESRFRKLSSRIDAQQVAIRQALSTMWL